MSTDKYSNDHTIIIDSGSGTLNIDGNLNIDETLTVSDEATFSTINVDGLGLFNSLVDIDGTLTVDGATTLRDNLTVQGRTFLPGTPGLPAGVISLTSPVNRTSNIGGKALAAYVITTFLGNDVTSTGSSGIGTNNDTFGVVFAIPLSAFGIPDNATIQAIYAWGQADAADCNIEIELISIDRKTGGSFASIALDSTTSTISGGLTAGATSIGEEIDYPSKCYYIQSGVFGSPASDTMTLTSITVNWTQTELFYASVSST